MGLPPPPRAGAAAGRARRERAVRTDPGDSKLECPARMHVWCGKPRQAARRVDCRLCVFPEARGVGRRLGPSPGSRAGRAGAVPASRKRRRAGKNTRAPRNARPGARFATSRRLRFVRIFVPFFRPRPSAPPLRSDGYNRRRPGASRSQACALPRNTRLPSSKATQSRISAGRRRMASPRASGVKNAKSPTVRGRSEGGRGRAAAAGREGRVRPKSKVRARHEEDAWKSVASVAKVNI